VSIGKLQLQAPYEAQIPGALDSNGFKLLLPTPSHFAEVIKLPRHHGDPFDRLIAQAKVEQMEIVSCDPSFPAYGVALVW
jgi:PIN domain nuclease of toxin-antitoxin system